MRCQRILLLGVVSQLSALECGDVDNMMVTSFDEEPVCSVSLLQHRAAPKRKKEAVDVAFSSVAASEDASLAVQELGDAIGKLVSVERASGSTGAFEADKSASLLDARGPEGILDMPSKIKEEARQEASHALMSMQDAFTELFSEHGAGKVVEGAKKQAARTGHRSHHNRVVFTQMSASESNPPPLVFSWEGSPLTSDFEDAAASTSLNIGNESSHANQTSDKTTKLTSKVDGNMNETKQSQQGNATQETSNSTVSLDTPFINDTVYVEASSVANSSHAQEDARRMAPNSSSDMSSKADVVEVANVTAEASNSTMLAANQTSRAGDEIATDGVSATVANQIVEMDGDEIAMPVFVFNGTKLAEDIDDVVSEDAAAKRANLEMQGTSLYSVPSDILSDMDRTSQHMDQFASNLVEDAGVGGSIAGLAQVDQKFDKLSARVGEEEIASQTLHAMSEISIKLSSLQSALAKMDSAELAL